MKPAEFKQQLTQVFNARSDYDNEGDFHPRLAHLFVKYAQINPGQSVLDMATGTGLVAIETAQIVGEKGRVVGVDLTAGMLAQSRLKISALGLKNIELIEADVETIEFPENSFDKILCCSALVYLRDIPGTLRRWYRFLKPGGMIGVTGVSETSYIRGVVLMKVAKKYGISLIFNQPNGTPEKCRALLENAGFVDVSVKIDDEFSGYLNWNRDEEEKTFPNFIKNPLCLPVWQLSDSQLQDMKAEYLDEMEALVTDKGIWNETLNYCFFGRKHFATA